MPVGRTCVSAPGFRESNRVRNHMRISFARLVCDTMETASLPWRRPSAGAVPGR